MNKTRLQKLIDREFSFFMAVPAIVWQVLFFVLPLMSMVLFSVVKTTTGIWGYQFSLDHYRALFDVMHIHTIFRSTVLALSTAATCLLLAYPVAYFLAVKIKYWKNLFLFLLVVPLWTNLIVLAYAWFFVLDRSGLINFILLRSGIIAEPLPLLNSMFSIFVVMVYCYLPFMVMPIYTSLEKLDTRLLEASADLGASSVQTFFRITLPLSLSGIKTGFFLVFIPSFGEFVIPSLLGGDRKLMVGSLISHYFLLVRDGAAGAAFTITAALILMGILWVINRTLHALLDGSGRVQQ